MARQQGEITVDGLVEALFRGARDPSEKARDLSGTQLPVGSDLAGHPRYKELLCVLQAHDHTAQPFCIDGVSWRVIQAQGLYLPFVQGMGARLVGAYLEGADLAGADLRAVKGLKVAHNPEHAHYSGTRLSRENEWLAKRVKEQEEQRKDYFIIE